MTLGRGTLCLERIKDREWPGAQVQGVEAYMIGGSCAASTHLHTDILRCHHWGPHDDLWYAQREAILLRGEVLQDESVVLQVQTPTKPESEQPAKTSKKQQVRFNEQVNIHVMAEWSHANAPSIQISSTSLQTWHDKPWSLRKSPKACVPNDTVPIAGHIEWQLHTPQAATNGFAEAIADAFKNQNKQQLDIIAQNAQDDSKIAIKTYGYFQANRGHRCIGVRVSEANHLPILIAELWKDQVASNFLQVFLLTPQPQENGIELHFIVGDVREEGILLLIDLKDNVNVEGEAIANKIAPRSTAYDMVVATQGFIEDDSHYITRNGGVIWLNFQPLPLQHGQVWSILQHTPAPPVLQLMQQQASLLVDCPPVGLWHRHGDLPEDYLELIAESDRQNDPQNMPRGPTTFEGEDQWIRIATVINDRGATPTWINLHGLYGEGVGSHRAVVTAFSQAILERIIAERWPLLEHLVKRAFVVTPQPDDVAAHELTFLIEFIDPFDMPHESVRPVLEEIVVITAEHHRDKQRNPLYLTAGSSFEDIVNGIPGCDPFHHSHRCDVWLGGAPVRLRERPLILSGHLLVVRVLPLESSPTDDVVLNFPGAHIFEQFAITASAKLPMSQLTWTIHKIEHPGEVHRTVVLHPEWTMAHSAQHLLQLIRQSNSFQVDEDGFHCAIVKHQPLDYWNLHFVCGRQDPGQCLVLASFTQKWDELWQEHHSYQLPNRLSLLDIAGILQLDAFNAWTLFLNGRPFGAIGPVTLHPGDVLDIEVEESSEEEDEMSAMQHWPSMPFDLKDACRDHLDLACPVEKCDSGELVRYWKPNPQITTPFDEIIPDMQRTPAGPVVRGRILPPPLWEENLEFRIALAAGACSRGVDGHLRVRIRSWIVRHGSPPESTFRDFTMRPQLFIHLRDTLKRIWRDRIIGQEALTFHVVRPSPPAEPDGSRLLHVIVELNRPPECVMQPMLIALRHITREGVANPIWCVGLFPPRFTTQDIHRTCSLRCEMHQLLVPLGGNIRRWMTPYMERQTTAGLFVPGWWDLRLRPTPAMPYEEDEETVALMQRSASRTPRRPNVTPPSTDSVVSAVLAHAFHMSDEYRLVVLDQSAPLSYHQQFEAAWRMPTHVHLLNLHTVGNPPLDLEGTADITFLLEMSTDRNRQATPTDKLVLLDIIIMEASQVEPSSHFRRTVWLRRLMTRQAVLQFASAAHVCEVPEVQCELKINHQLWNEDDTAQRQILHGDFLRLQINGQSSQAVTDIQMALCEQESADIQKYIYRHSPPHSPSSLQEQERSEASGSQARSPNSPNDEATMTASGLPSSRQFVKGHPHVLDRWCDDLEQSVPSNGCGPSKEAPHQIKLDASPPLCLHLADLISPPAEIKVPCTHLHFLRQQLINLDLGPAGDRAQVVKWHPSTQEMLLSTPDWTWEPPISYELYTDGSSAFLDDARTGAAAVILVVNTVHGPRFGGTRCFDVKSPSTAPLSEVTAMVGAILWAVTLAERHPTWSPHFTFGFDCTLAGNAAAGLWIPTHHLDSQAIVRSLCHWIHARFGNQTTTWRHIKSHTGHPWNEAADALSWAAVAGWIPTCSISDVLSNVLLVDQHPDLHQWLWFLESSLQGKPGTPRVDLDGFYFSLDAPFKSKPDPDLQPLSKRRSKEAPSSARVLTEFCLRCATANVLSLQSKALGARAEHLAKQFADAGLHCIGLQETRSAISGHQFFGDFHVLSAPAVRGVGGIQCWIAHTWPLAAGAINIRASDLHILSSTSQRLVIRLRHAALRLLIVVAHAPSDGNLDTYARFWHSTSMAIPASYKQWKHLYLADANARLGSIPSSQVGQAGAEQENDSGAIFHASVACGPRHHCSTDIPPAPRWIPLFMDSCSWATPSPT